MSPQPRPWREALGWAAAGAYLGLPFLANSLEPLAFVAALPWILLARRSQPGRSLVRFAGLSWLAGFAFVFLGLSWLHHVSSIAVVALAAVFGAHAAISLLVIGPLARAWSIPVWLAAPLGILTAEGLCSLVAVFDVTWLYQGYLAWRWTELLQLAEWGGISLVSALIWFVAGSLAHLLERRDALRRLATWAPLLLAVSAVAAAAWAGARRVESLALRDGPRVALVQGNHPMSIKLDPAQVPAMLNNHLRLTRELDGEDLDLVAWPETAVLMALEAEEHAQRAIGRAAARVGVPIVTGSYGLNPEHDPPAPSNSAFLVSCEGRIEGRQDKRVLVPGAETLLFVDAIPPLREALGDLLSRTMGFRPYLVPGTRPVVLDPQGLRIGALICYGDVVPVPAEQLRGAGAEILLTLSNEAWFGAREMQQHLAMAVVRCIETRMPMGRATNTGLTCAIDPAGRVTDSLPTNESGVLVATLKLTDRPPAPPWLRRLPTGLALAISAALALLAGRRKRSAGQASA